MFGVRVHAHCLAVKALPRRVRDRRPFVRSWALLGRYAPSRGVASRLAPDCARVPAELPVDLRVRQQRVLRSNICESSSARSSRGAGPL